MKTRKELRGKRKARIRAVISGTGSRPRLALFRSNQRLSAQVIDDNKHVTIVSALARGKNTAEAKMLGASIAKQVIAKKITAVVFDRGGFRYHGVIKAFADAAREGGLQF